MAFGVAEDREVPDATLVEEYSVYRLGREAILKVSYVEVVFDTEPFVEVTLAEDLDSDGLFEVLTIPSWRGRTDLVGRELFGVDKQSIGVVASFTDASVDGQGVETTPAKITLASGLATSTGFQTTLRRTMIGIDVPAYRLARGGRRWEIHFSTGSELGATLVQQLMGTAYFNAAKAVLDVMGVSYTVESLTSAIQATSENIDSFIAAQGEFVEEQRRAGALSWMVPFGSPPLTQAA